MVAMDLKPSSVTKERTFLEEHKRFLQIATLREVFIKMVVSKEIDVSEFRDLCALVREIDSNIPIILQPISGTDHEGHDDPELMRLLNELQRIASSFVSNARIVPRLHKILKIR